MTFLLWVVIWIIVLCIVLGLLRLLVRKAPFIDADMKPLIDWGLLAVLVIGIILIILYNVPGRVWVP